jgi:uncharacterized protein YcnI
MKKTLISLAIAGSALLSQSVMAHSSIVEQTIVEGERAYLTIQVPHGCKNDAGDKKMTNGIIIKMPNSQEEIDAGWAFTSVAPVQSYVKEQRTKTVSVQMANRDGVVEATDIVSEIALLHLHLPYSWVLKAQFRGRAPMLPEGEMEKELNFDIVQYCPDGTTAEWTMANGKAAHVTVVKAPEGEAAHH